MPLADFTPEMEVLAFKGGSFTVRGLALADISLLVRSHWDDMEALLRVWDASGAEALTPRGLERFVLQLCRDAPAFAVSVVLVAADEAENPAARAVAGKLPFPVLVHALDRIGHLTFLEAGGLGNFTAALGSLLGGLRPAPLPAAAPPPATAAPVSSAAEAA